MFGNIARFRYLLFICIVAALGGFLFGFDTAVISGVVGFVKDEFQMSSAKEGWFVSCALLGCIIGVAAAGSLSDKYGRKKLLLLSALLFTISAVGCMFSTTEAVLIGFRLTGGLGIGVASMVSPLFISEFAPASLRGRLVTLYQLAITIGILIAYLSNSTLLTLSVGTAFSGHPFLHWVVNEHVWRSMLGLGVIPSALFLFGLLLVPESPRWLLMNHQEKKALRLFGKINGAPLTQENINEIKTSPDEKKSTMKDLFSPVYRTALLIGILLPFLSQVSGINAIIYYGPRILDEAGFTLGHAFSGQVTIGIINMVFTFVAIFTVDRWGRKPLLFLGVSLAIIALIVIGILFNAGVTDGPWILLFLLSYIASFAFSFGPVCWVIIGEIFPTAIRGRAMALGTLSLWVANFFIGQLTPMMLDSIGPAVTFWLFAIACSPTIWLLWKVIPETKGRSLEEIETYWKNKQITAVKP